MTDTLSPLMIFSPRAICSIPDVVEKMRSWVSSRMRLISWSKPKKKKTFWNEQAGWINFVITLQGSTEASSVAAENDDGLAHVTFKASRHGSILQFKINRRMKTIVCWKMQRSHINQSVASPSASNFRIFIEILQVTIFVETICANYQGRKKIFPS